MPLETLVCGCIAAGQNKSPAPSEDARQKKSPAEAGLNLKLCQR
nr:MAG TPA: hypothetical protein [Caudoviricetes sp.]